MLNTFTSAGQRHSMAKVVAFLSEHPGRSPHAVGRRNRAMLAALRRESTRALPDVARFSRQTESVLALLAAIA